MTKLTILIIANDIININLPMTNKRQKKPHLASKGQILISILIGIAVFAILIHTVFTLVQSSFELIGLNRARVTARHLAQEKVEKIRNMNYDDIGTVGGIPDGLIAPAEDIERNNIEMTVHTSVVYIDDPFDGQAPADLDPEDYKRVRVEVEWQGLNQQKNQPITFITDISPGLVTSSTGGTLRILVFDADGNPVPEADVHIVASTLSTPVDTTQQTNSQGEIILPGAEPCNECYEITVTKPAYSTDRTYSTSEVTNPNQPHASVIEGDLTQVSFAIDLTSNLTIASKDSRENSFSDLGNVNFQLRGEKTIGYNGVGQPVYKYDENLSTDGSGSLLLEDLEWDVYHVILPDGGSYSLSGSNPLLPLPLLPDTDVSLDFSVEAYSQHNLLTIVKDESQNTLENVYIHLYDGGSVDEASTSGNLDDPDFGQLLFSGLDDTTTYNLDATASGYLDFSTTVTVFGPTKNEIIMRQ